ncbi:MAG: HD family hydrolase [Promethearchaeota archaeon]
MTLLDFLLICNTLKRIPRTGWLIRGATPTTAETVAGHSHTTALVAYFLALQDEKVDIRHLLLMALIHDLPEAELGDISRTPSPELRDFYHAKRLAESQVMTSLLSNLGPEIRTELANVWQDYITGTSHESRIVEAADRIATIIQALHLIRIGHQRELFKPFFADAEKSIASLEIPLASETMKTLRKEAGL